ERDDLKLKLEKFQTSSKNLTDLLASQTNEKTRHSIQPIETPIPAATPALASSMSNSSGKRRNRKACFAPVVSADQVKQGTWGNPQQALKDKRLINSGCSRHMIGNMSYLSNFKELNGGYVAFGGNPKGGKITGKGKIKTGKLDFNDVYFVKELKFNLFSVSQICDKKNSVLFTDTQCVVLSPDFKLPDENQVLLRVPRENNMYNVNLKNIVPSGDLTYLFAKATIDESNLWHRRLGHINFKTTNKLVQGNLVRGLPIKFLKMIIPVLLVRKASNTEPLAEAVNTSCYVQNKALVTKPHNKTPYELLHAKVDEGFLVGYSVCSKAFRAFNSRSCIIQETLHVNFLENKPNVAGTGPTWLFDIDSLTRTMNYPPVTAGNFTNSGVGFEDAFDAEKAREEVDQTYVLFPMWSAGLTNPQKNDTDAAFDGKEHDIDPKKPKSVVIHSSSSSAQTKKLVDKTKKEDKGKSPVEPFTGYRDLNAKFKDCSTNSSNEVNATGSIVPTVGYNFINNTNTFSAVGPSNTTVSPTYGKSSFVDASKLPDDTDMPELEDITYSDDEGVVGAEADFNNLESSIPVSLIPTTRIHKDHPVSQIIGDMSLTTQTKNMTRAVKDQGRSVCLSTPGFEDLDHPNKVYKVVKALYGLHQALRACTPIDTEKPLLKDSDGEDVDVYIYSKKDLSISKGKSHFGLWYPKDSPFDLVAYSDSDYAGASLDRKSTTGGCAMDLESIARLWTNDVTRLQALVDRKKVVITEAAIRDILVLDDAEGVDCLPDEEIFAELARMGYEKPSTKLTFYKAFFSSQWKFLIYTILQSMSAKRPSWDEFSSAMTSAVICLSTGVIEGEGNVEEQVQDVADDVAVQGADTAVIEDAIQEQSIPSPTPPTLPPQQPQDLPSTSQVQHTPPQSPQPQPQSQPQAQQQFVNFPISLLQEALDAYAALTRRVEHLKCDKAAQDLEISKLKRRVKKLEKGNRVKGRMIDDLDKDAGVALKDDKEEEKKSEEAKVAGDDQSNDVTRLRALVDKKKVVITEATIRDVLRLDDAEGVDCLPNEEIFAELARMGRKFNFLKYIFESLVRNLDNSSKFYMYPRVGKGFSGVETPLFEGMLVAGVIEEECDVDEQVQGVAADTADQALDACAALARRFEHLECDKAAQALEISKLKRRVKKLEKGNRVKVLKLQRRKIDDLDKDEDVALMDDKEAEKKAEEAKEVVDVVTTAKLITEVVTTASESVDAASITIADEPQVPAATITVVPQQPQPQPQAQQQAAEFPMSLLQEPLDAFDALTRRVEHLEYDKVAQALEITKLKRRVDTSEDTVRYDASNHGRIIDELDKDDVVALMDDKEDEKKEEEANVVEDDQVYGRLAESQAEIYKIDLDHASKVLSMQEDEPAEVQEVVDVVTTTKLITEVVTGASEIVTTASTTISAVEPKVLAATITVAPVRVAAASTRRRKGVIIRDPEEESTTSLIIPVDTKSKDKGKGTMVEEPKPLKKKQQVEMDEEYARKLHVELNKDIDWDVAIDHVKQKAKEDPAVQRYQVMKKRPQIEA
nr:ribonuclease H-like domain-containing protein [Tanacetum cinerariifolium]